MTLLSQTEAAKRLGVSQPFIAKLVKQGKIQRHGSKVDFDELVDFKSTSSPKVQNIERHDEGATTKKRVPNYNEARAFREAFNAKLAELDYEERKGKIIRVEKAYQIMDDRFLSVSAKLDRIHIDLKNQFSDTPIEAMEWLQEEINKIKAAATNNWNR
jgi:DNA-binding Lrp family transcriptional regulator